MLLNEKSYRLNNVSIISRFWRILGVTLTEKLPHTENTIHEVNFFETHPPLDFIFTSTGQFPGFCEVNLCHISKGTSRQLNFHFKIVFLYNNSYIYRINFLQGILIEEKITSLDVWKFVFCHIKIWRKRN